MTHSGKNISCQHFVVDPSYSFDLMTDYNVDLGLYLSSFVSSLQLESLKLTVAGSDGAD